MSTTRRPRRFGPDGRPSSVVWHSTRESATSLLALSPAECKTRWVNRAHRSCERSVVTSLAAGSPRAGAVQSRHLRPTSRREAARSALALAAAGAGAIHLSAAPVHVADWAPLGYGFLAAAALQLAWAVALVRREGRGLLVAGAAGTALVTAVWVASRTTGLPVGPHAGVPEAVGTADALCVALQVPVVLGALALAVRPRALRAPAGRRVRRAGWLAAALVAGATGVAAAAPPHAHPSADLPGTPMVETGVDANANGVDDGVEAYFAAQLLEAHRGHEGYPQPPEAPPAG
jgi:hypothetical protein